MKIKNIASEQIIYFAEQNLLVFHLYAWAAMTAVLCVSVVVVIGLPCNCAHRHDPVCALNGRTYHNSCLARYAHAAANLLLVGLCLLTILHQCTEAVQCKHGLLVILTENKKFNLRFDSRQSRTGHPQSQILATPVVQSHFNN